MKRHVVIGAISLSVAAAFQAAGAQAPCSLSADRADSARADLYAVLSSGSPLVAELRKEQGLAEKDNGERATVVKDRLACAHLASNFGHALKRGATFPVLRIGSLYYGRDPDQQKGTGVLTDSTFKVLMRFGAAVEGKP